MNEHVRKENASNFHGALAVPPRKTIFDLPNEILSLIFAAGPDVAHRKSNQIPFPLLVSSVNSHWRVLSQHTPKLWTLIIPPLHKGRQVCLAFTSLWMKRSATLLVSAVLDTRTSESDAAFQSDAVGLIPIVLSHLIKIGYNRLRRLDVFTWEEWEFWHPPIAFHLLRHAPHLQQLSVTFSESDWNYPHEDRIIETIPISRDWDWLLTLPRLRKLRWSGLDVPLIPNLTTLNACYLSLEYEDVRTLFNTCPDLTHLVLDGIRPLSPSTSTPREYNIIQANSLRSLAVRRLLPLRRNDTYIFQFLSISNLEYLEVGSIPNVSSIFGSSISPESVETLRILNRPSGFRLNRKHQTKEDLAFFYSFSNLRNLQIIQAPTAILLADLTHVHRGDPMDTKIPPPSKIPWPKLCTVTLDSDSSTDVTCLYELISLHKDMSLKQVWLSDSAMHRLSAPFIRKEWFAGRVELRTLPDDDRGLLDSGFPPSELP